MMEMNIIGPGMEFISNDEEVLSRAELFNLREALEEHLKNKEEVTHVVNHTTKTGNKWLYLFCVHTLEGDTGFTLLVSDKAQAEAKDFADAIIKHRLDSTGVTSYHRVNDRTDIGDA